MKRALLGILSLFTLFCGNFVCRAGAAGPNIQDGLWEMTMETKMEGLPMALPPTSTTVQQCLSTSDPLLKNPETMKGCRVKNQVVSGNKVSWEFECANDEGKASGKGAMTYSGSSSTGSMKIVMTSKEGEKISSTIKTNGRRIGVCPAGGVVAQVGGGNDAKFKEMREKSERIQGEYEASLKRGIELTRITVPKEKADACVHLLAGAVNTDCDGRWGKLPLQEGEWEITEEQAVKGHDGTVMPAYSMASKECLSPANPVKPKYLGGCGPVELKRSGNTVTWKTVCSAGQGKVEGKGGVELKGTAFEGALIETNSALPATPMTTYYRLTGKRIGDGNCVARGRDYSGRDYSGRAYSAGGEKTKKAKKTEPADTVEKVLENPVRKLRSLFGY